MYPNKVYLFIDPDGVLTLCKENQVKKEDTGYVREMIHDRVESSNQTLAKENQELAAELVEATEEARMTKTHVEDYQKASAKLSSNVDESIAQLMVLKTQLQKGIEQIQVLRREKIVMGLDINTQLMTIERLEKELEPLKDPWRNIKDGPATFPCLIRNGDDYKIVFNLTIGEENAPDRWEGLTESDYELTHFWPEWRPIVI